MNPKRMFARTSISNENSSIEETPSMQVEYLKAVVYYKWWKFLIYPKTWYSVNEEMEFEVEISHKNCGQWTLILGDVWSTEFHERLLSMESAIQQVRKFITNELH